MAESVHASLIPMEAHLHPPELRGGSLQVYAPQRDGYDRALATAHELGPPEDMSPGVAAVVAGKKKPG